MFQRFDKHGQSKGWFFQYKDPLSGQWREKRGGSTREACRIARTRCEHAILSGKFAGRPESFMRFARETYLPEQKVKVSSDTYQRERGVIENHFKRFFDCDIHLINEEKVSQFKTRRLQEKGGSPDTVHKELQILSHVFSKAVDYNRATRNPVDKVDFPKPAPGRVRYLSPDEMKAWPKVIAALPIQMRPVVSLMQHTALRRSEALGLAWSDVDLENGILIVRKDKRGKVKILPLSGPAVEILRVQPRINEQVFPCVDEDYLTQKFREATVTAGIQNFRLHDLRHNFASHLAMQGVDVLTLRDLLGHSDTRMTSRYTHLAAQHLKRAVDKLPEVFERLSEEGEEEKERVN